MAAMMTKLKSVTIPQSIDNLSIKSLQNVSNLTNDSQQIVAIFPGVLPNTTYRNYQALVIYQPIEDDKKRLSK